MGFQAPETVVLTRDCKAVAIPSGQGIELFKGTEVRITQSLGGSFTVVTLQGAMASIDGRDAEALGKPVPAAVLAANAAPEGPADLAAVEKQVWAQLKTCFDPEIPHNIVDLGLVYECKVTEPESGAFEVAVRMTLTAPGCGMGDFISKDAERKIQNLPQVRKAAVQVVFDPPWTPEKMNPALRRELY